MSEFRGGGDPLRAMYFIAAVLMGLASVAVVLMMLLPRDILSSANPEDVWVPGSGPGYHAPDRAIPDDDPRESPEAQEELHYH